MGDIRTVIVDCDLRRSSLDQIIGRRAKVGLLDVLSGRATVDQALILDEASGAYFLPVGASSQAQKSVFDSPSMDRLLAELRQRFALVVLDGPPVLALADARLIAQKADTTIVLSRWRQTPRKAVEDAMRALADADAVVAGLSLSQVDLEKLQATGYGNAGYSYLREYGEYFAE
jgi:Mrp family chromosome partitioning ATPase